MIRLTQKRQERGWSQAKLARASETDQGLLSKIESSRVKPYPKELERIADALGQPRDKAHLLVQEVGADEN